MTAYSLYVHKRKRYLQLQAIKKKPLRTSESNWDRCSTPKIRMVSLLGICSTGMAIGPTTNSCFCDAAIGGMGIELTRRRCVGMRSVYGLRAVFI